MRAALIGLLLALLMPLSASSQGGGGVYGDLISMALERPGSVTFFGVNVTVTAAGVGTYTCIEVQVPADVKAVVLLTASAAADQYTIESWATTRLTSPAALNPATNLTFGPALESTLIEGHVTSAPIANATGGFSININAAQSFNQPVLFGPGTFATICNGAANDDFYNAGFYFAEVH